jgi:hypothetical protein
MVALVFVPGAGMRALATTLRLPAAGSSTLSTGSAVPDPGLLVEHHAADEVSLRRLVRTSLDALGRNRNLSFPSAGIKVAGVHCVDEPVCALVVAAFESAAWASVSRPTVVAVCAAACE